ncbi:MAG: P-loop NTPase, partial [Pseudomonadota bacterium]
MGEAPRREAVEEHLLALSLPGGGTVGSEKRLRSLVVEGGRVGFALAADASERATMERVRQEAEAALKALPGIERVLGALVDDDPAPSGSPRTPPEKPGRGIMQKVRRLAGRSDGGGAPQPSARSPGPSRSATPSPPGRAGAKQGGAARTGPVDGVQRIIAVGAGKGGVGKSTVSLNLAVTLAALGWRTGLLDADIYGPSVPILTGAATHQPSSGDGGFRPFKAHGIDAMSIGFLVAPEKAVVWRGPMVTGALNQMLRDTR